ncbi:unnamed protein product [Candidula unifasciata]|uniref:Uncharacterized protein n=1 Tax=Candidula unifasciata TaxID=100452 RepID=A0A8S3YR83_9EUPU|nr:unnamed protein product [Candidula unifasciata]
MSHSRPCIVRLSRLLRYLVLVTFCAMISFSGYIFLNFLPTFEKGQLISQRRSPLIRDDNEVGFAPRDVPGHLLKHSNNFRERYRHLYESQPISFGSDVVKDSKKCFIYRCDTNKMSGCGDWADHVKGIEAAYLIANLTGRVFKAEMHGFPCKFADFIQPNLVNWTLYKTFHPIHSILYKRLFLLVPRLLKKLELFLYSVLPSPEHRLICVDLGTKTNLLRSFEDNRSNQLNYLSNVWSFIRTNSLTNIDKVFINTDSPEVLSLAKTEIFKSRLVTSPQKRPSSAHSEQLQSVCESLEADIFSQHILVNCDILVVSSNSLGHLAAYLRETDKGLYCLMGNGHIHPCRADRLNELYTMHE